MLGFFPLASAPLASSGTVTYVLLDGLQANAVVGQLPVTPVGVSATASVGSVSVLLQQLVNVSGLQATGYVGSVNLVFIWTSIVPNQNPNYTPIVPSPAIGYA